ncbi:hypothetical protein AFC81_02545 [Mycobacterium avium subsp. paratuberculosis]|nr:hypothetical protein AFC81_02545 [Mycobacterium avium subsp. paratuberculosis]OHW74302.1 hypothetical protein AFC82_04600 [Mycobacterium avium subsp. paratuberculosis]OHW75338.1 hypothetical protein AFC79_03495 [Mycobacterium avium subsp. paratuberculosis]OHW82800.1 hypothetical protein AFC83_03750 [Mycobacterium avium subsp. paratuberculosis]OHW87158.1 hypothetical protein AFC85_04595 [Mycobacterium avium subsp. paratuberculosis]
MSCAAIVWHCRATSAVALEASASALLIAAPSGICCAPMAAIVPPPAAVSAAMKLAPAVAQAAAAARNFAESPVGQIIPIYGATQPQPAGAPLP